jgi:hypothetical protein
MGLIGFEYGWKVVYRGAEFFFCPTPRFLSNNLSNEVRMLFCRNCDKRSVILGLRYTIFNIHWTMCPISIGKGV